MAPDTECYLAIVALIDALHVFDFVDYGIGLNDVQAKADQSKVCVVNAKTFINSDLYDPIVMIRTCRGEIAIAVRDQEHQERQRTIDHLAALVQNAVTGKSLADKTEPPKTWVSAGRMDPNPHPELRMILNVEFVYATDDYGGLPETE